MLPTSLDPAELAAKVQELWAANEHLRLLSRCDHARRQDAERQLSVALYQLEQNAHNDGGGADG